MNATQLISQTGRRAAEAPAPAVAPPRCTLCPAGCELELAAAGPDAWRIEYPRTPKSGACPRGSCLAELLGHPRRILTPACRSNGRLGAIDLPQALREILYAAGEGEVAILLDGNIPCEQLQAAANWCRAWPQARLCFVVEPADEQLLLGTEAGGADYLADGDIAACDGFLIVGGVFAANPACSRGIFDRRRAQAAAPIVVIDPAAGACAKFATHRVQAGAGMELAALRQLASAAGVDVSDRGAGWRPAPGAGGWTCSAVEAGKALAQCRRVAVLIAAEYGRAAPWRQIGYLAGRIAAALGGGVAPQTVGANALAAVRLGAKLATAPLAKAISGDGAGTRGLKPAVIAIGCDPLGMLGWADAGRGPAPAILAAAAALPNPTTRAAQFVLPATMTGEHAGTFLLDGARQTAVSALLPGPAGVLSPADLVAALAYEAGVRPREEQVQPSAAERLDPGPPGPAPASEVPPGPLLLLQRDASHSGSGALTAHASWSWPVGRSRRPLEARVSPQQAGKLNLSNLAEVNVRAGGRSVRARVRIAPELTGQTVVLPDGLAETRALLPSRIDGETGAVAAAPAAAQVER